MLEFCLVESIKRELARETHSNRYDRVFCDATMYREMYTDDNTHLRICTVSYAYVDYIVGEACTVRRLVNSRAAGTPGQSQFHQRAHTPAVFSLLSPLPFRVFCIPLLPPSPRSSLFGPCGRIKSCIINLPRERSQSLYALRFNTLG